MIVFHQVCVIRQEMESRKPGEKGRRREGGREGGGRKRGEEGGERGEKIVLLL